MTLRTATASLPDSRRFAFACVTGEACKGKEVEDGEHSRREAAWADGDLDQRAASAWSTSADRRAALCFGQVGEGSDHACTCRF